MSHPQLQPSNLVACYTTEPQVQKRQIVPEMAVDLADKENLPVTAPAAAAAAVARLRGVAVRRCKLKRLGRARGRLPLRDITNLFVVESAVVEWQHALLHQPQEGSERAAAAVAVVQNRLAGGAAAKVGRYSLRKEFR